MTKGTEGVIIMCVFSKVVYLDGVCVKSPEIKSEYPFGRLNDHSNKIEKYDPETKTVWVVKKY